MNRVMKRIIRNHSDRAAARMAQGFMVAVDGATIQVSDLPVIDALRAAIAEMLRKGRSEILRPLSVDVAARFPGFVPHADWSDRAWLAVVLDDDGMPYAAVQQEGPSDISQQCRVGAARSAALFTAWRNSLSPLANLANLPPAGRA